MDSQVTTSYQKSGTEDPKSSNINDIIRSVLNILFFFYQKGFTSIKKRKTACSKEKWKKRIKNI